MDFFSVTQQNILFWLHSTPHICLNQQADGKEIKEGTKES